MIEYEQAELLIQAEIVRWDGNGSATTEAMEPVIRRIWLNRFTAADVALVNRLWTGTEGYRESQKERIEIRDDIDLQAACRELMACTGRGYEVAIEYNTGRRGHKTQDCVVRLFRNRGKRQGEYRALTLNEALEAANEGSLGFP